MGTSSASPPNVIYEISGTNLAQPGFAETLLRLHTPSTAQPGACVDAPPTGELRPGHAALT